MSEVQL